jgi:hypothetical protein
MPFKIQWEMQNYFSYDAQLCNLQLFEIKIFITWEIVFNIAFLWHAKLLDTPMPNFQNRQNK